MNDSMFTEDERTILRCLPKEFEWIARDSKPDGARIYAYTVKPVKNEKYGAYTNELPYQRISIPYKHIFKSVTWEGGPIKFRGQILDKAEKKYLTAVLKPLPKVNCIIKARSPIFQEREYLGVNFETGEVMVFPFFEEQTMYKGMKTDKAYTLEKLGINLDQKEGKQ